MLQTYCDYNRKDNNSDFINKILYEYLNIVNSIKYANDIKLMLSDIYYYYVKDIVKYGRLTGISTSDYLWINNITNNNVSYNMLNRFCNTMFRVLIAKHSVDKIEEDLFKLLFI